MLKVIKSKLFLVTKYSVLIIEVFESVGFDIPDKTLCGNSIVLDATVTGANYLWSTGNTDSIQTINSTHASIASIMAAAANLAGT